MGRVLRSDPAHQDILEYRKKQRPLRVRFLDGAVKTILVDDSQNVVDLTKAICARIGTSFPCDNHVIIMSLTPPGLTNPEEFSFTTEEETSDQTVRRHQQYVRDQKKLETLKKKLHTDDECEWGGCEDVRMCVECVECMS